MATVIDFRLLKFDPKAVDRSGTYIGHRTYWKLYAIENLLRVVVHSILSVQIPTNWWGIAVDKTIRTKAEDRQSRQLEKHWRGKPGTHGIYFIDLTDLNEVLRANANLFSPVIPEIDKWLVGIEELRLPRNVVAHMNFPNIDERKRIDAFYFDCQKLIGQVGNKIEIKIP